MTNWSQIEDPFAFIDAEAGTMPSAQFHHILNSPFLNVHTSPAACGDHRPPPAAMTHSVSAPDIGLGFGSGARMLPVTVRGPTEEGNGKDSRGKTGSCNVNPSIKVPTVEKTGSFCENLTDTNGKTGCCNVNLKDLSEKTRSYHANSSVETEHMLVRLEKMIGEIDVLDIAEMKGIRFDPPRWHMPCGYNSKAKDSK